MGQFSSDVLGAWGFWLLVVLTVKINVMRDVKPYSLADSYERVQGNFCLHVHVKGRRFI
jgi:hypothetical protein